MKKYLTLFLFIVSLIGGYFDKKENNSEITIIRFALKELTLTHSK